MGKFFKKSFILLCSIAILLAPFFSACGIKAPPKPPIKKSEKLEKEKRKEEKGNSKEEKGNSKEEIGNSKEERGTDKN